MYCNAAQARGYGAAPNAAWAGDCSKRGRAPFVLALLFAFAAVSCGAPAGRSSRVSAAYVDGSIDLHTLALRFAPVLSLQPDEPYSVAAVVAVFHPSRPIIAYHIFFDDAFLDESGASLDHEISWVEYDPVTLKVADVFTLWHQSVLRTDRCLEDAKASGQRPSIDVQWGQHGLLPSGWRSLMTARPRLELATHYEAARHIDRLSNASATKRAVSFRGSYDDYLTFTVKVRTADYIQEENVTSVEHSLEFLKSLLKADFPPRKEWPDW